jgi:hypothetical protein
VIDLDGESARGCARHAVQALNGITGLRVDWDDSRGLNEYERSAIELAEERSTTPVHVIMLAASGNSQSLRVNHIQPCLDFLRL